MKDEEENNCRYGIEIETFQNAMKWFSTRRPGI